MNKLKNIFFEWVNWGGCRPLNVREDKVVQDVCFYDIVKNAKRFEEDYFVAPTVNVPVDAKKAKK